MGMTSQVVSVTTAATLLASVDGVAEVVIKNAGAASVFLGGSGVTTATGLELAAGATLTVQVDEELYGIVAAGTADAQVLRRA